nr:DUF5693 family protein [Cohnella zeiphila]
MIGTLPVIYSRVQTEASAKKVEFVMDYQDLLQMSLTQPNPSAFVQAQLQSLKAAGVTAMAIYESNLTELGLSGEVTVYSASQAALLEGKLATPDDNRTYLLFNKPEDEPTLRPIVEQTFNKAGVEMSDWSVQGRSGMIINLSPEDAAARQMQPNPIEMKSLHDQGFLVVPRLSDRSVPYDDAQAADWINQFKELGVTRIIFDGDAVTGFASQAESNSLKQFANHLKEAGIGVGAIENLKVPQKGLGTLAKLLDYNVVRVHSISEAEMNAAQPTTLVDRFLLAVKDRNIRIIYLNGMAVRDSSKGQITTPVEKIGQALTGDKEENLKGTLERIQDFGFVPGEAHAFSIHKAPAEALWRALAIAGSVALIAIAIGLFIPAILLPVTLIGAIGGAATFVLQSSLLTQALALFVAIASPTVSLVLLIRWFRNKREKGGAVPSSAWGRLGGAILLYIRTSILSVFAVPFVIALLSDITYSLVLQQFRGVSLLHLAPIALVALYAVLYGYGGSVMHNLKTLLKQPITVLWVIIIAIVGAVGMYYLSRTGNSGEATGLELHLRTILEDTFGVRPRTKEFLLGHPIFLVGLFLAFRYRWALVLLVVASVGQLSMVDTFAHIHTPAYLSAIRDLLGLGIGALIGLVGIVVWQVLEALWRLYRPRPQAGR